MAWGSILVALLAMAPEPQGAGRPGTRIAVLDLVYTGEGDHAPVDGLSALLASETASRPALAVVYGADLKAVLCFERQRQALGCTASACLAELGGALGVRYLISSEVSRVGSSWLLSLALLDATRATSMSRLTRKAASLDELVDQTFGAVDELLSALGASGAAPPSTRFDGAWEVAVDCPPTSEGSGAKGYAYRFPATVKDGRLAGRRLAEGAPGSLQVEGAIRSDGKAQLTAQGVTGSAEYNLKRAAAGSAYGYGIAARFEGDRGSGQRVEGRACSFGFVRK